MLKIILILFLIFIFVGLVSSQYVRVYKYKIPYSNLPDEFDGFKILHISDWHNRGFGNRIVRLINNSNADIILVTGDMVQRNNIGDNTFFELMNSIERRVPMYLIFGNHELGVEFKKHKSGFLEDYKKRISDCGARLLDNESVSLKKGNSEIIISGLTVPLENYSKLKKPLLLSAEDICGKIGEKGDAFTVLLAHTPESFEGYAGWGADLCLCGHNHGGIINIPFIGGLVSAAIEIFPKYDKGIFKINNSTMILNRGTGNNGCSIRFFNNPEIGLITLKKE